MALTRDSVALRIRKWASAVGALKQTPETAGLTRATGWPAAYGVDQFPELETFNGLLEEITAGLVELAESGAFLPWNSAQQYRHYAYVVGSNGTVYQSVQDSLNEDPTTDTNNTYWSPVVFGQIATNDQVEAGSSSSLIVAPARLLGALFKSNVNARWHALTNRYGLVRRATSSQVTTRTGDGYVRAADLPASANVPNSSTTQRGVIRTATTSEADAGTATSPAMTPALVKRLIDAALGGLDVGIQPSNPQFAVLTETVAGSDLTWRDVINIASGSGLLNSLYADAGANREAEIRVTIDGDTPVTLSSSDADEARAFYQMVGIDAAPVAGVPRWQGMARYGSSLRVEVRLGEVSGNQGPLRCSAFYTTDI